MTGAVAQLEGPPHPALRDALQRFQQDGRGRRDPRLGITGPPGSGKSQLLQGLLCNLCASGQEWPRLPLLLDLKEAPSGSLEELYSFAAEQLIAAAARQGQEVIAANLPASAPHRFEAVLRQVAQCTNGDVIFAVDRLENVPVQFADNLAQRIRGMKECADAQPALGRMALIVSGAISLFELSHNGKSALFQMPIQRLPHTERESGHRFLMELLARHGVHEVDPAALDKLWELTGAECSFLEPLLVSPRPNRQRMSAESLVAAAERVPLFDHLRQIALHLQDESLRQTVENLVTDGVVRRRNADPAIDPYQLAGVLVVEESHGTQLYRFRNGMVERMLTLALKRPRLGGNRKRLGSGHTAILSELIDLDAAKRELESAPDIFACNGPLQRSWTLLTPYHNPALDLYFAAPDRAPECLPLVPADEDGHPASREAAAQCFATGKTAFGWETEFAAFAVPVTAGNHDPVCLVTTVPRPRLFTEFALTHWQRFLGACGATLARLGLAEIGRRSLAKPAVIPRAETRMAARAGRRGELVLMPEQVAASDGGPWQLLPGKLEERRLNSLNKRVLNFVREGMSRVDFLTGVSEFSDEFLSQLDKIDGLKDALSEDAQHWIVSSTLDGLKWPLEILRPDTGAALATRGVLARRIRGYRPPRELRAPFRELLADLRERKRTLRVLLVSSNTGGLPNARGEIEAIEKRLGDSCNALKLALFPKVLVDPVERELHDAFLNRSEPWHLFHFCGHGKHGTNTSALLMKDSAGEQTEVRGETLQQWLHDAGLWLCFLNTCYAGTVSGSSDDNEILSRGLVENVLAAGVPTFAGFRSAVTAESSRALALEFYKRLLEEPDGSDPSLAVYRARKEVAGSQLYSPDAAFSSLLVSQYVE